MTGFGPADRDGDTDTALQGPQEPARLAPARNPTWLQQPAVLGCFSPHFSLYLRRGREGSWRRCPSTQPGLRDLAAQLTTSINSPPKLKYCSSFWPSPGPFRFFSRFVCTICGQTVPARTRVAPASSPFGSHASCRRAASCQVSLPAPSALPSHEASAGCARGDGLLMRASPYPSIKPEHPTLEQNARPRGCWKLTRSML